MVKLLCFAMLMLSVPAGLGAQAEMKAVLAIVIADKNVAQYLAHYKQNKLIGYCATPPSYNGKPLAPTFTVIGRNGQLVCFTVNAAKAVLVIESVTVNEQQATVLLHIPLEGVTGKFSLRRRAGWMITSSEIFEQ